LAGNRRTGGYLVLNPTQAKLRLPQLSLELRDRKLAMVLVMREGKFVAALIPPPESDDERVVEVFVRRYVRNLDVEPLSLSVHTPLTEARNKFPHLIKTLEQGRYGVVFIYRRYTKWNREVRAAMVPATSVREGLIQDRPKGLMEELLH